MLNVLQVRVLAKFCQNEWDAALLILEADVHIVIGKSFSDRFFNIFVAFDEALNLNLLLKHLLQIDCFLTDALLLRVDLSIELGIVLEELHDTWFILIHYQLFLALLNL